MFEETFWVVNWPDWIYKILEVQSGDVIIHLTSTQVSLQLFLFIHRFFENFQPYKHCHFTEISDPCKSHQSQWNEQHSGSEYSIYQKL